MSTSSSSSSGQDVEGGDGGGGGGGGGEFEGPSSSRSRMRSSNGVWPEPFLEALAFQVAIDASHTVGRLAAAQALFNIFQVQFAYPFLHTQIHAVCVCVCFVFLCDFNVYGWEKEL